MAEIADQVKILKDAQQKNEAVETAQREKLDKIDVPVGEIFEVVEISNMASREKFMAINKDKKEKMEELEKTIKRIKFQIAVDKEINAKEPNKRRIRRRRSVIHDDGWGLRWCRNGRIWKILNGWMDGLDEVLIRRSLLIAGKCLFYSCGYTTSLITT
ncbi:hypothetical protein MAA_00818 [Metarhizium robertsii ARSEF 23]|nr:uncharacterized protein MAA_00818 [Metarhizium robertsii ARSEF 23]EFZ03744.2 hypothetical protein MAA_00818 [Metarhizium robertsii ARSEF 23]